VLSPKASLSKNDMKPLYLTTTLPYVNSDPHIGFALEIVHADIFARAARMQGKEVFFNTGTDEHGQKIDEAARKAGLDTQVYVDGYAEKFRGLKEVLGLSADIHFVRTTDAAHKAAAQEFWRYCVKAGDIYKKQYQTKYCVGCELEKTDSELEGGKCPIHPNMSIQLIDEENYFFRYSKYQQALLDLYAGKGPQPRLDFVVPDFRFNEIKAFVARGLEDFSISRLKSKMSWGIPVPDQPAGEAEQVIYVWFDALVNYISTIGWPQDAAGATASFAKWWTEAGGVIQFAGKDQVRMQAAMWQAMLMSATAGGAKGLVPSKQIVIHGFITSGGQKMSKSLGNVINPYDIVKEYGTDALRYFLAREVHPFEDSDVTLTRIKDAYNANLANGLGNLVSRVMKMAQDNLPEPVAVTATKKPIPSEFFTHLEKYEVSKAADYIWAEIADMDKYIQTNQPFKVVKTDTLAGQTMISELVTRLHLVASMLAPIMPETMIKMQEAIKANKAPTTPLFLRKD